MNFAGLDRHWAGPVENANRVRQLVIRAQILIELAAVRLLNPGGQMEDLKVRVGLRSTDLVRYIPDNANGESASLS